MKEAPTGGAIGTIAGTIAGAILGKSSPRRTGSACWALLGAIGGGARRARDRAAGDASDATTTSCSARRRRQLLTRRYDRAPPFAQGETVRLDGTHGAARARRGAASDAASDALRPYQERAS